MESPITSRRRVAMLLAAITAAALLAGAAPPRRLLPPAGTAELVYVALGDSTVAGIGATSVATNYPSRIAERLRATRHQVRLVNLGVAGADASDVVAAQLDRATALRPTLVTLSIGPNDVTTGVTAADYERNVERILRTLQERTTAVVVLNLLPDLGFTPRIATSPRRDAVERRVAEWNAILRRTAAAFDAELVDLFAYSRNEVPSRPDLIAGDGYHPSDAGYARWAELMWQAIERRLPRASG